MPPKKQQLDQFAWSWAETVEPENVLWDHLVVAYRLNLKACKRNTCRRNCKGNPKCVNALGEGKWFNEIDESAWHEIDDPESERRDRASFAGLKNLGATCYVNSFLQVWFHNQDIRRAVFGWRECLSEKSLLQLSQDLTVLRSICTAEELENLLTPPTICGHLQHMFALLQFSKRRYVDPTPFVNSLGLNATLQQDAQEFSKLFMSLLEDTLSQQQTPEPQNFVMSHFKGLYEYVTRCSFCLSESRQSSDFYELDLNIKGHKTVDDCIGEFLKEEKLEEDNKYMCSACNRKQNAVRKIQLRELPQILNLQLLRFVFERQTGHKKKLNTFIEFPEKLDMSGYLRKTEDSVVYNLSAVLIHRGPSAYSGHYVAHVKDSLSHVWYKFNDEQIEKMAAKNLYLANEEELEGKGPKKPKTAKGCHTSRNAYTLMYLRGDVTEDRDVSRIEVSGKQCVSSGGQTTGQFNIPGEGCSGQQAKLASNTTLTIDQTQHTAHDSITITDLPLRTQKYLEYDNMCFEEWVEDMKKIRKNNVDSGKARQTEVSSVFNMLQWKEGAEFDWIKTEWLSKWMSSETSDKIPPVDNTSLLCSHGKLDPHKVPHAKCISREAAEALYSKYGGVTRLQRGSMCIQCVRERCRIIRTKARMAEDSKLITAFNKTKDHLLSRDECFWVGKQSLRCWRRLALELIQESQESCDNIKKDQLDAEFVTPDDRVCGYRFVCGLLVDQLSNTESHKGCEAVEYDVKTGPCEGPSEPRSGGEESKTPSGKASEVTCTDSEQQQHFNEDILCEDHNKLHIDQSSRKLVTPHIWQRLKWYFPTAADYRGDAETCEECRAAVGAELRLKAYHKATAFEQKASLGDVYAEKKRPTWQNAETELNVVTVEFIEQWRRFIRDPKHLPPEEFNNSSLLCPHGGFLYSPQTTSTDVMSDRTYLLYPKEWAALKTYYKVDLEISIVCVKENSGHVTFIVTPDVCEECQGARELAEMQSKLQYTDATVYVRKVTENLTVHSAVGGESGGSETPSEACVSSENCMSDSDIIEQDTSKRKKSFSEESYPVGKSMKVECLSLAGSIRRSTRHRKARGEKELTVSSSHTLRDLKLQIMKLFSVAPYDQNLMSEGKLLQGDLSTLESLQIYPGSVIYLKADEPVEDPVFLEDISKASYPEEGFKGTGLLGR